MELPAGSNESGGCCGEDEEDTVIISSRKRAVQIRGTNKKGSVRAFRDTR